ncbi:hypothetical protein [Polaribacter sp. KT 15]|uniref:hypothetical protein n=1 Tax=Polaribacter sp. KT 15 TaxID=1896175 RepID=UPI00090BB7A9|nr:hypothetical protein [Polaribacter sp. KT 15]SHM92260.1 hypothetical protein SAMN05720268_1422 [Polaribacter sp. KT 15]
MKNSLKIVFFIASLSAFSQSPWTKEKKDLFLNLSYTSIANYNELFGDPDYKTEKNITDKTYQIYGEYGLTNKTAFVFNIPLKSIKTEDTNNLISSLDSGSKTAFGNISLGLKHQFYNKNWVISGQLVTELNTSTFDENTKIRTGYDAFTFTPQLLIGKSFGKTFLQTQIGADIRTNDYSNNFKIGGEFGGKISKNIWLIGFVDIVKNLDNGVYKPGEINPQTLTPRNGLYVTDQEYGAYGLKGILQLCDLGITTSFGNAFFGNNVPKKTAFSIGIFNTF